MPFLIINRYGDPGSPHATREECFEIIDGMVRDGLAEPGEFWVVEHDENGRVVGEPCPAPSRLEEARRAPSESVGSSRLSSAEDRSNPGASERLSMTYAPDRKIAELIAELDGDDTNRAEDVQAELEPYGAAVLFPLIEVMPRFGIFGQLCAIELFEHIGDPRAGAVLIPMLRSENETVREWAARALGDLGVREAVAELHLAYEGVRQRRTPLDWSEPQTIRDALTRLGGRVEVVPDLVRDLPRVEPIIGRCWLPSDLPAVIESLATARQVVLSFTFWESWRDTRTWVETPGWLLDWSLPWDRLVESARAGALDAAGQVGTPKDTVAVVTWLDEADR